MFKFGPSSKTKRKQFIIYIYNWECLWIINPPPFPPIELTFAFPSHRRFNLVNNAFLLEVDADCGYELICEGPVGVLMKQRGFADAGVAEAQEFDEIVVVSSLQRRHRRRAVVHHRMDVADFLCADT